MTKKEKQAEAKEIEQAVRVLRATLRGIAKRKAHQYELQFLSQVRDIIDHEISLAQEVTQTLAQMVGNEVSEEISK